MKISEVSKKTGLSPSAIRYYINYGLISPRHTDYQYDFSQVDIDDLLIIQKYKRLSFSLDDILKLLVLRHLSHVSDNKDIQQFNGLLSSRVDNLRIEQEKIVSNISEIEDMYISDNKIQTQNCSGVPLCALQILRCPHCQGKLAIRDATIWEEEIVSAGMSCKCGYEAIILDGILQTDSVLDVREQEFYQPDRSLLEDYDAFRLKDYVEYEREIRQRLLKKDMRGKIIIETNVRKWFFLLKNLEMLDNEATYIISSPYVQVLQTYKNQLDKLCFKRNIVYIAGQPSKLPILKKSIDYWLDYFDTGEHFELSPQFLPQEMKRYLKESGEVFGISACIQSKNIDTDRCDGDIAMAFSDFTKNHFIDMMEQNMYSFLDWVDFKTLYRYAIRDTYNVRTSELSYGTFRFFAYHARYMDKKM